MANPIEIHLCRTVATVDILTDPAYGGSSQIRRDAGAPITMLSAEIAKTEALKRELEKDKAEFANARQALCGVIEKLNRFYDEAVETHRVEIAKLAVEIARKVVMQQVCRGRYEIEPIITEALKRAPVPRDIVVRLNPADLGRCVEIQQNEPAGQFANVEFVADPTIGRAECLLETPKGIVKSFLEEHLQRIGDALEKAR